MKRSNRLVILVGVLLAVLAFVAIVILLNQRDPVSNDPTEPETVSVLVATRDIAIGDAVTPDMVEGSEIPIEAVQSGALLDASQLGNRTALFELPAGAQVTERLFGGETSTVDIAGQLLPGEKAYAVQFDPVTGLNFLVQQGDHVDIIMTLNFVPEETLGSSSAGPGGNEIVRSVKAVLQNKRVLYVSATNIPPPPQFDEEGNEIPPTDAEAPGTIIAVLAVSNADAELLAFAQSNATEVGSLAMTLRQASDEAIEDTPGVTLADVFETYGLPIPTEIVDLNAPEAPEAP